jgi:heterodisulfide reductase subunit B
MDNSPAETVHTIQPELARRVQEELGQNVYLCYQCIKCTSGCPVAAFFDWQPNQIMRAVQLGQTDIALTSKTPWLCAACETCTTRCPQGLDIAAIMEFLARESVRQGHKPAVPEVRYFNQAFMREIRLWGRSYEVGLMVEMKLRTRNLLGDMDLGVKMLRRNKLPFLPARVRSPRQVKRYPGASEAVAYYPGCSLHSTAAEFNSSAKAVAAALDVKLVEPPGWVCCGSSAAHRADPEAALRLPYENLALVEQSGFREVTMPCAACFNRHKTTLHAIHTTPAEKPPLDQVVGYTYQDKVRVTTLVESLYEHAGVDKVRQRVRQPLAGLKVVAYYGCLMTRPPAVTGAAHPENPTEMDELLTALGAHVIDWSYKTVCCGAAHSLTRPDIVLKLSRNLIEHAHAAGAEVIAVACPLCHTNLDARQFQMGLSEPLPVMYFTQLMAVALGLPAKAAALHKNLVDPRPTLAQKQIMVSL